MHRSNNAKFRMNILEAERNDFVLKINSNNLNSFFLISYSLLTLKKSKPQYHFQAWKLPLGRNKLKPAKDGRIMGVLHKPANEDVSYADLLMVNSNPEVLVLY